MSNFIFCIILAQLAQAELPLKDARIIMEKNQEVRRLGTVTADTSLMNTDTKGAQQTKTFTWWRKLAPNQIQFNTLTRFHSPPEVKDEAILFLEKETGQAEVLLYLPAYKKTRRVENQGQSKSFMGSQLSYSDVATPHLDDYNYKLLPSTECHDGGQCYVVETVPKTAEVKERTGYTKQLQAIRSDNFMLSSAEFYDLENKKLKQLKAKDTKMVDSSANKWMSHRIEVENLQNQKRTTLEFTNVKVNLPLADMLFNPQNLPKK